MTSRLEVRGAQWVGFGSAALLQALADLDNDGLDAPSNLPGWSRRMLISHLAANADALLRLLSWARTGVVTPMYSSPEQRADDIAAGSLLPTEELRSWVTRGVGNFSETVAAMPNSAWSTQVLTAQGRTVSADEVPWMRAREVCIHAVDLNTGTNFQDLPTTFCSELISDVTAWRTARGNGPALRLTAIDHAGAWHVHGEGEVRKIELPIADLAAWLSGRTVRPNLPELPSWI